MQVLQLSELDYYYVDHVAYPPMLTGGPVRPLNAEEVTAACELLLEQALIHDCSYWLLDGCSPHLARPFALYEWVLEDYLPRVRAELGRPVCIAFIVPAVLRGGLPDQGHDALADRNCAAARLGWFTNKADALRWLAQQRVGPAFAPAKGLTAEPVRVR